MAIFFDLLILATCPWPLLFQRLPQGLCLTLCAAFWLCSWLFQGPVLFVRWQSRSARWSAPLLNSSQHQLRSGKPPDRGVTPPAIAEGLAMKIAKGDVPYKLLDKEVYLLDLTALVAGTQFRGQFESRMKGLIEEIKKLGNIILVIDEVHNIVGAGDAEGSMNAANILKPALSRGELQVIGATTLNEYRKHIEKDTALERRFQPVIVEEPSIEDSVQIIEGIAPTTRPTTRSSSPLRCAAWPSP